jgi:hypothetical protein
MLVRPSEMVVRRALGSLGRWPLCHTGAASAARRLLSKSLLGWWLAA